MNEPIAIVGSACRFPGAATSPSKLWDLLKAPRDVIRDFPAERLNLSSFYSPDGEHHGRTDVQNRAYLLQEDCRLFDASFFRINPKEAHSMDPQQRILLETVYESLEAAGWPMDVIDGSLTSVHVGVMSLDFNDIQMRDPETLPTYTATGVARSILSNRISYFFNMKGPSITIDTACSSSLVALHQAVQGLRNGEACQAVVAGTTLLLDPAMYIAESKLHMLSPDSRSRMWDKDANGYARGEGIAAILLKPLSKAIQDNDHVECIIRQTGVNSDGRTNGITMPSSSAQTELIRQTYANAKLDLVNDRCQYFECHGTGTAAGDPVEARAIQEAFFPNKSQPRDKPPLYCGSVKTVIGHLEGCAGLAGILKAALAIQNKAIPPNMHFNQLNPAITPYYDNLSVPTSLVPWPDTGNKPLRASINSFGFGGTNAHVILESYEACPSVPATRDPTDALVVPSPLSGPFVFSAKNRSSLLRVLKNYSEYIHLTPSLDLDALSWVLQSRRTAFSTRLVIAALDRQRLLDLLKKHITVGESSPDAALGNRAVAVAPRILGVFTGQGAQWAKMGQQLKAHCHLFRESLERCESALRALPDAPSWSLTQELDVEYAKSRISQAEFSQPLCTAIQVALVDLLRAIGIHFNAVVGHSSGEIGAAYAAGILTVKDAMGIAFYRGFVSRLAKGPQKQEGGMMAVGISFDAALAFCSQPEFGGRVSVAASNAPSSVTLSGDLDAIHEAKSSFDENGVFARSLKVDTAYHSAHMLRCAEKYMECLQKLDIRLQAPRNDCVWSSSVHVEADFSTGPLDQLEGQYWVDNMVKPVLFSQALQASVRRSGPFASGLEVGPHPALKSAVSQTLKPILDESFPYIGCLERNGNDMEAMSAALGLIWSYLGPSVVNFNSWREAFQRSSQPQMIKNLPSCVWDHDQIYWHESRSVRNYRLGLQRPHELLGRLREEGQHGMAWRNMLTPNELPWLRGHTFQNQIIFPGAGYVSMAVQAAELFVRSHTIKMVEIQDLKIHRALVVDEDSAGVETLFTLRSRFSHDAVEDNAVLEADFVCYCCSDGHILDKSCDGRLLIHLGLPKSGDLPPSSISQAELPSLDVDRFFKAVADLGIGYKGVFRAMRSINRMFGHSQASASWAKGDLGENYVLHPAILDVAFQAGLATFASLAENAMGCTYLPAEIRRVIVDPKQKYRQPLGDTSIAIEAHLAKSTSTTLEVDISMCHNSSSASGVQVDGLVLKAVAEPLPSDDRLLFAKTIWDADAAFTLPRPPLVETRKAEIEYIDAVDRTALYYLQKLFIDIHPEEVTAFKWHHRTLLDGISTILSPIREGRHAIFKKDWLNDSRETVQSFVNRYPDSVDLALLTAVGENLSSVVRGQSEMLEHMLKDNLLGRLYAEGRGFAACNEHVAALMRKISHKYPRTKILEIGAGTGSTTRSVLDAIGNAYSSYTYTDISAGFFEKAGEKFADHVHQMDFKTLNAEYHPAEQGFVSESYDIVIAANVLHATRTLLQTMRHARSLLRPGGFLIAVEVTGNMLRETGLMAGLEGWWLGADDGRFPGPGISAKGWHDILQNSGFSGIETIIYDMPDISRHNCSVFYTQAVDERFELLRDPLSSMELVPEAKVLVIGGQTLQVSKAVRQVEKLLRRCTPFVTVCASIDDLCASNIEPETSVLCLAELDQAIFSETMNAKRLENLQELLGYAQNVLWVTSGGLSNDPYSHMMTGIGRALSFELPHVKMQFLDFDNQSSWDMEMLVQYLLRLVLLSSLRYRDHNMLWVQEPEVMANSNTTMVPRIVSDTVANEGLNAKRRRITRLVDRSERVEVRHGTSELSIIKMNNYSKSRDYIEIEVELSLALHIPFETPRFLCFGHLQGTDRSAFAITETDSSIAMVSEQNVFEPPAPSNCDCGTLVAIAAALVALHILSHSPVHGTILVHEPNDNIAGAVSEVAGMRGRKVLFVGASSEKKGSDWVSIHPLAQSRVVRHLVPADTSLLLRCSNVEVGNILPCLPQNCTVQDIRPETISCQTSTLAAAYDLGASLTLQASASVINIKDAAEYLPGSNRLGNVLDWKRTGPLNVIIPPLDVRGIFSADKTYFLVGMAGELGQSLCRYMTEHGARHIVLASRHPVSDAQWLEDLRLVGADVRVVRMDVTDRMQVKKTAAMVRETMPEIAGVANAALVLEDSLFVNATVANFEHQLKPKVDGTMYLDDEFANDNLDFFIAFSSLGSVYGNAGQSIYHAANMFMTSLVEKRRRRGQAGSVINIGMIVDVGYVAKNEREGVRIEDHLRSQFYIPLAETDFHHLILQAVLSGRPGSASGDVTMGIRHFVDIPNASLRPHWYDNPRFSHMILPPLSTEEAALSSTSAQQLREKFKSAESIIEATEAFQELFCKKIESMMKVPAASIDVHGPLSDLGLDSLLAVEIRTWLLRDVHFEVPLLTILGREPMSSICLNAARAHLEAKGTAIGSKVADAKEVPAEAIATPAAPGTDHNSIRGLANASAARVKDTHDISSTSDSPPPATIPSPERTPYSSSPSVSQDATNSSASSLADSTVLLADLEDPKTALEYSHIERMSYAQASLFFLQSFLADPTTFNVTAQYKVNGPLNVNRFERALEKTLAHHEAYQTCFFTDHATLELKQGVVSNIHQDRFTHIYSKITEDVQKVFQTLATRAWKLATGQTFQAVLITHAPDSHTVIIGCHHMIMDGLSWHLFFSDLDIAYRMLPLVSPRKSYLDFSRQEMEAMSSGRLEESVKYWMRVLDPIPRVLPLLPFAQSRSRKVRRAYGNHIVERELSSEVVQSVKEASRACNATPMQFYIAAVQALFARLMGVEDMCIGVTDAGRADGEFANAIGHFTNLLPMRFSPHKGQTFGELLSDTSRTILNGFEHARVPIDMILERLDMQRSSAYTPLYQVAFNYRIGDLLQRTMGNCNMNLIKYEDTKKPYDLTFNITQTSEGGHFIEVCSNDFLYSADATEMVMDTFVSLLKSASTDPTIKVQDCKLNADEQVERALQLGQGSKVNHPWPMTLVKRFHQVAISFPDVVAIKDNEGSMTYAQLARQVNVLAEALINSGIGLASRLAVLCQPSIDTYLTMLAILHIGAVYVPLDMSLPAARHRAMVSECKPELIIFHSATTSAVAQVVEGDVATLDLSELPKSFAHTQQVPPATAVRESFVLFTSGSTGTPKGIMLSQSGIMNYAASKSAKLGLGQVRVLQQSSTGFDMSIAQAFNAFANAGTLVIAPLKARGDPVMLAQLILAEAVEFTICTPSEYSLLVAYGADLLRQCKLWRYACSGGEAVSDALISELQRLELPSLTLMDCYGPTEISCAATFQTIPLHVNADDARASHSVGTAIPNTSVYILGDNDETLPIGFPGEIYIGGAGVGVAGGYLDPRLTSLKFILNPFATPEDIAQGWQFMYKTGDRGYLREDGSLVFLGRTDGDSLVKLRGLRIELNEVANVILDAAQGSLADAVITLRGQPEFLVAHVLCAHGRRLDQSELDTLCANLPLPQYMIPSMILAPDRLPTTANGKIDIKAVGELPLPVRSHESDEKELLTVPEGELRLIWKDILGEAASAAIIRRDTDFFTVGGSSLLLVRLQNALKERMGIQLPLHELYQASTLRKMAAFTNNERSQLVAETIDWEAETSIPTIVLDAAKDQASPAPQRNQRHILLTGATGFLGSEILKALKGDEDIAQIHCIAVPADAKHKLPLSTKITVYLGSLLSPSLGLSGKEESFLQSNIDQIIHAGAQGHCLNNYSSVRHANYLSTQFLASMALSRHVPMHFVSSARVILQSGSCQSSPVSMAASPPPTDGSQGFTASKWASECFLESVARDTGLPVAIHRPCSIIGAHAPHDDAMNSVVKFSLLGRTVPAVPNAKGYFDFKDVVDVATEIARGPVAEGLISFRHHSSGVRVPFDQFAQRMEFLHGGKFAVVSMSDWISSALKLGIDDLIVSYLEANVANAPNLTFPFLGMT